MVIPQEDLVVIPPVIGAARGHVIRVREGFENLVSPVGSACSLASGGAGQFAADLEIGLASFQLSWEAVLGVCADSAGLIAANTGHAVLNVHAVDVSHASTVRL